MSPHLLCGWTLTKSVRFVLRDYSFDENALERQKQELQTAHISEKELWVGLTALVSGGIGEQSPDGAPPIIKNQFL